MKKKITRKIKSYKMRFVDKGLLKNVFNKRYTKSILISYITFPFYNDINRPMHTNLLEAIEIAKIFDELEYKVDVVDWDNTKICKFDKYDMIFGFGKPFEMIVKERGSETISIAYLTFANPYYANIAEFDRVLDFEKRKNVKAVLKRQMFDFLDNNINRKVSAAICLGNSWSKSTYSKSFFKIYSTPASGLNAITYSSINRDIMNSRCNFLWFAGGGNIHKGLDLCIEAFAELRDCNLFIAGPREEEVFSAYREELALPNIHYLGKISVYSNEYKNVCEKCSFSILPSCSEGQSTAVLTTMFSGMIPIVTKECGIDIEDIGYYISDSSVNGLIELVKNLKLLDVEDLKNRHRKAYEYANNNHTLEVFKESIKRIIINNIL